MRTVRAAIALAAFLLPMPQPQPSFALAIRHARVVHGDGSVTPRATVFVASGRIARIDDTRAADDVAAAREILAGGRTLIPGLIDAHVHVQPWTLPLFLRYGVTGVRDVHNAPALVFSLAGADVPDRPRVVAAGAMLDGPGSFWPNAMIVDDAAAARDAVRRQVEAGAGLIKVYSRLRPAMISAVVREARARGVPVAAHLGRTTALEAATAGVASIEHLSGIADAASRDRDRLRKAHDDFLDGWTAFELEWLSLSPASLDEVARQLIARGVTIVPTLALHEAFSRLADPALLHDPALADVPATTLKAWAPEDLMGRARWTAATLDQFKRALPVLQRFVGRYAALGGRVAAGTDTAQQFVVPGASLHRELELYVAAGLSPARALRSATADAADLLGISARAGTIAVGKDADLVLIDGDPLADIRATRRILTVIRLGVVVR
jgi:imidazolonepropionase-like amidohydrolase